MAIYDFLTTCLSKRKPFHPLQKISNIYIPQFDSRSKKIKRGIKRNPLKNIRVMARLNPHAVALKKIRKKEQADKLKAKKERIEKAKKLHKVMKEARKKRKASGQLKKKEAAK